MTTLEKYDLEQIKGRLPMVEVLQREGIALRRSGTGFVGRCPFHEEKTGSFNVGSQRPDRAHCFGCGWSGDIVEYWMHAREVDFKTAVEQLASLAGLAPRMEGVKFAHATRERKRAVDAVPAERVKPLLPPMRALKQAEIEALAALRKLSVEGVKIAAQTMKRVGFAWWPQSQECAVHAWNCHCKHDDGKCIPMNSWGRNRTSVGSWVVTDSARAVAQFRTMDGRNYFDREGMKCMSKGSPTWPLGASEIGERPFVLMVEGGADMLAAYHFLWGYSMLGKVAVCCMLGASNRIAEDALPFFRNKLVRIMADADETKAKTLTGAGGTERVKYTTPGLDAALRWQHQLAGAGAVAETYSLYNLVQFDGKPVKDLNDLAQCSAKTIKEENLGEAFCSWDF